MNGGTDIKDRKDIEGSKAGTASKAGKTGKTGGGDGREAGSETASTDAGRKLPAPGLWLLSLLCLAAVLVKIFGLAGGTLTAPHRISGNPMAERFDWREAGKTPAVKSQGKKATCWALTAVSALEAKFLPQKELHFSADHLSLNNGFVISQEEGGDYRMIMAYLSGWRGPVPEEEDPFGDGKTQDGLTAGVHVQQMLILDGREESFKRMLLSCGPLQSSLYMDRKTTSAALPYYKEETCSYYYPEQKRATHDVLILGWDDGWPKQNFKMEPERDGAWICQNTWGSDFGDDGIFYVSYEDANFAKTGLAYARVDLPGVYDSIYQTDVCGWQGRQGYDQPDCYFANVFTAKADETLRAVGFYSTGAHSDYELYVVHDFEDKGSFAHKRFAGEGSIKGRGYFTVELDTEQELKAGERFAVLVNIHTEGTGKPVAVEVKKDRFTQNVVTEGKEGYLSLYGGEWESAEERYGTNICLKAYTSRRGGR